MTTYKELVSAASGGIEYIFKPGINDRVLIVTDKERGKIARAFEESLVNFGCRVTVYEIESKARPLKEIPSELEVLLPGKTIVLNIFLAFSEEIPFRIKWIFKIEENKKTRLAHMPGITEEMIVRSVNVDFVGMKQTSAILKKSLQDADRLHITTTEGTDIILGVNGRLFSDDISIKEGEMCNLPCGEIYCAPLETEANGVVVFNASIGDIGIPGKPVRVKVNGGRIENFESEDAELVKKLSELTNVDEDARVIGELGIGINPGARITGNMLEDEKALGTAHIAFGNNEDFPGGGGNRSKIHRDYLFYRPTIEIRYNNVSEALVIKNGEIIPR